MICFFFFNDTATTEIYTLSLHDALPISPICPQCVLAKRQRFARQHLNLQRRRSEEHTSNSSHLVISYAVFCLKKKNIRVDREWYVLHPALVLRCVDDGRCVCRLDTWLLV